MMLSRRETGSYQCTAFVLRNLRECERTTLPSYYEAVFTSGSCIRNQRAAVDATFYWKHPTSTCDGPAPSLGSLDVTRGARLWDGSAVRGISGSEHAGSPLSELFRTLEGDSGAWRKPSGLQLDSVALCAVSRDFLGGHCDATIQAEPLPV